MLDILSLIEISANRPRIALEVLARRRSLRSRDSSRAFDDSLLVARLLMTTGQYFAARTELTDLLSKSKAAGWNGILSALGLYVEAEEQCSVNMQGILARGLAAAIRMYDLPVPMPAEGVDVREAVREAHRVFFAASKSHSGLILQAVEATTADKFAVVIKELEDRIGKEPVGYFQRLQQHMLGQLKRSRQPK